MRIDKGAFAGEQHGWKRQMLTCACERMPPLVEAGCAETSVPIYELYLRSLANGATDFDTCQSELFLLRAMMQSWTAGPERGSPDAVAELKRLHLVINAAASPHVLCNISVEFAILLHSEGNLGEADAVFHQALKSAIRAGSSQPFMRPSPVIGVLLERACDRLDRGSTDKDILPIVEGLLSDWRALNDALPSTTAARPVANSLSDRERAVLENVCHGQTNKSIARSLGISPETVKSHMKRIFMKLSVNTRSEAVARVKALGML